jgi:predicted sulfurtransferase
MTCDVTAFSEHQAHFRDGTVEDIDIVFYCTGNIRVEILQCGRIC